MITVMLNRSNVLGLKQSIPFLRELLAELEQTEKIYGARYALYNV